MSIVKAAMALVLIGLALQVGDVGASSSITTETAKEASATFETQANGLRTSVEITVAETELVSSDGTDRGLHVDIEILQHDTRGGKNRMIDVAGSVDTRIEGLDVIADDLSTASLDITIPVCGAKVGHNGRLKQRPFNECFDVQVALEWTATGEIYSASGTDEYPQENCVVHILSSYRRNAASAAGTIAVGDAHLAAGNSASAAIGSGKRSTTAICPTSPQALEPLSRESSGRKPLI